MLAYVCSRLASDASPSYRYFAPACPRRRRRPTGATHGERCYCTVYGERVRASRYTRRRSAHESEVQTEAQAQAQAQCTALRSTFQEFGQLAGRLRPPKPVHCPASHSLSLEEHAHTSQDNQNGLSFRCLSMCLKFARKVTVARGNECRAHQRTFPINGRCSQMENALLCSVDSSVFAVPQLHSVCGSLDCC